MADRGRADFPSEPNRVTIELPPSHIIASCSVIDGSAVNSVVRVVDSVFFCGLNHDRMLFGSLVGMTAHSNMDTVCCMIWQVGYGRVSFDAEYLSVSSKLS